MAVPFGRVTDNALLGNIGPDIPIDFTTIGHVNTDIKQKIEPHGINTTAIQIIMEMEVTLQVIIPFHTKEIKVKQDVPIATRIVQGEVPTYYGSGSVVVPDKRKRIVSRIKKITVAYCYGYRFVFARSFRSQRLKCMYGSKAHSV